MPELIVVTGPSHAGKSTLAARLVDALGVPAGRVAIDNLLGTLNLTGEAKWSIGIPFAYDAALATAQALVEHGLTAVVESTFTFVPVTDPPEFHRSQVQRYADLGATVIRLTASIETVLERQRRSHRLSAKIVGGTAQLHAQAVDWPAHTIELDAERLDADAVLAAALGAIHVGA